MENASKALIMAAEILFGVILLMIFVGAFAAWRNVADGINDNIELTNIQEFNSKFEVYEGKDLTAHDIISIVRLANEYNYPDGYDMDDDYKIKIDGISDIKEIMKMKIETFLQNNLNKKFRIIDIKYNPTTSFVKTITIESEEIKEQ